MPTIFTHPAPALALAAGFGAHIIPPRLAVAAVICAILPDLDVVGFAFGVKYANILGHRGFSHSFLFALILGVLMFFSAPWLHCKRLTAFWVASLAVASHIVLDAMTSGGLGVAWFWPWTEERYFLPWRPIRVSPFSPRALFSARGVAVFVSELLWVWVPCMLAVVLLRTTRKAAGSK